MPTYDYRCPGCRTLFEVRHRTTERPTACPRCGGEIERVFLQATAVHGTMARGREMAARSLPQCGKGCRCCP
jgi:putative FmdB family regulatory protein